MKFSFKFLTFQLFRFKQHNTKVINFLYIKLECMFFGLKYAWIYAGAKQRKLNFFLIKNIDLSNSFMALRLIERVRFLGDLSSGKGLF